MLPPWIDRISCSNTFIMPDVFPHAHSSHGMMSNQSHCRTMHWGGLNVGLIVHGCPVNDVFGLPMLNVHLGIMMLLLVLLTPKPKGFRPGVFISRNGIIWSEFLSHNKSHILSQDNYTSVWCSSSPSYQNLSTWGVPNRPVWYGTTQFFLKYFFHPQKEKPTYSYSGYIKTRRLWCKLWLSNTTCIKGRVHIIFQRFELVSHGDKVTLQMDEN